MKDVQHNPPEPKVMSWHDFLCPTNSQKLKEPSYTDIDDKEKEMDQQTVQYSITMYVQHFSKTSLKDAVV